ncbi:uncharacterized protein LOC135822882 [Sycon ciliatum]
MSLGAIGGKTLDQIANRHAFVSSIEPFIGGEEKGDERGEDEKSYGDPFQQRAFLTDISPWLGKLPAGTFRKMAQEAGFFADLEQIEDLKRIEERRGPRTHNEELVNIVRSEEQAGYIKLVKVIKRWGQYPDKVDKMNQLLPRQDHV